LMLIAGVGFACESTTDNLSSDPRETPLRMRRQEERLVNHQPAGSHLTPAVVFDELPKPTGYC